MLVCNTLADSAAGGASCDVNVRSLPRLVAIGIDCPKPWKEADAPVKTLSSDVSKLVTEHPQEIRDALRKLREAGTTSVTVKIGGEKTIVISRQTPTEPAK